MFERWKSREWIVGSGARSAIAGGACWILAAIFAVLGIIADVTNSALGLESASWLMLSIALFVGSASWYIGWAVAVHLHHKG
ncbi:hypothetical protein ACFLWM_02105 [Chloroflexota bacterium]